MLLELPWQVREALDRIRNGDHCARFYAFDGQPAGALVNPVHARKVNLQIWPADAFAGQSLIGQQEGGCRILCDRDPVARLGTARL